MSISQGNKLALGTAQFGLNYGISNKSGLVKKNQAKLILSQATKSNINLLDTAIAYGESEGILGEIGVRDFDVITKLPELPVGNVNVKKWAIDNVYLSINKLQVSSLYGILLHKSTDILGEKGKLLNEVLFELKSRGVVRKIGASIYDPYELNDMESAKIKMDIIQAPFNVFDRRLELSGWLERLGALETEVHVRSVFLQGLLLLPPGERHKYFSKWEAHFKIWDDWLKDNDIGALEACLKFVKSYSNIDISIVGVTDESQLLEIISKYEDNDNKITPKSLISNDKLLINPTNWFK
jgi:aryl-alcohol dehydrogenase-like predicted oxidoreductase